MPSLTLPRQTDTRVPEKGLKRLSFTLTHMSLPNTTRVLAAIPCPANTVALYAGLSGNTFALDLRNNATHEGKIKRRRAGKRTTIREGVPSQLVLPRSYRPPNAKICLGTTGSRKTKEKREGKQRKGKQTQKKRKKKRLCPSCGSLTGFSPHCNPHAQKTRQENRE
ncbi:uncharacterized protein KNAG_0D01400 [Huiozyma naganishii CBS 8797]|uniref:Uncharacterized protein n=1 Tax=Huiozyma naganishii (strain ATCC MYA-139 / BCRC 22969 / CBS 8797 / KCTC 17520 / NBRC 10181 / NCYC 3082 / Yp74L-3) TaxID=1071383 RepID=J7RXR1_HUIN7|nr:hypothetical protein KNAG_0D01400 [Kazachstania naganishii CBS 8797]CCK69892.1 hypothetical protein KNAG_0D01400 [Kazachstania naganishii CBS 8797]